MADRDEKIFPALPQKRTRAREQGNVARSRDLTSALSFLVATIMVGTGSWFIGKAALDNFRSSMALSGAIEMRAAITRALTLPLVLAIAVNAVLAIAATAGAAAQGGLVFASSRLAPDLSRLNPVAYFGRIFSIAGLVELGKAAAKVLVIATIAWLIARWALGAGLGVRDLGAALSVASAAMRRLCYASATLALVLAGADYGHKLYEHEMNLRMTRQEFLDELKQEEGNPHVKRALRRAQRKGFKRVRGVHQAATATVVLTNPTHLAVAMRYRRGFDQAPLVVAKGAGESAHRIIAIARLAAVPIQENRTLARALYKAVEVGNHIPRQFYRAIAEVLAAIMRAQAAANHPIQAMRSA
jgi:flagellar biosynthetic protein FlhB